MVNQTGMKTMLIAGAATYLGKTIAQKFAAEGWTVIATAREPEKLREMWQTFREKGYPLYVFPCDLGDEDHIRNLVTLSTRDLGGVDVLINCTGMEYRNTLELMSTELMSIEDFDELFKTWIRGTFLLTRYLVPHMKKRRNCGIINISTVLPSNLKNIPAGYCAADHALCGFTQSLGEKLKPEGIRVSLLIIENITENDTLPGSPPSTTSNAQIGKIYDTLSKMLNSPEIHWQKEVLPATPLEVIPPDAGKPRTRIPPGSSIKKITFKPFK